ATLELADVKSGYLSKPGDEVVELMRDSVRSVRHGAEPPLQAAGWLGDTASFGQKVPTIIFGPGGEPVYCPDEHLAIADIVEATEVDTEFAVRALSPRGRE